MPIATDEFALLGLLSNDSRVSPYCVGMALALRTQIRRMQPNAPMPSATVLEDYQGLQLDWRSEKDVTVTITPDGSALLFVWDEDNEEEDRTYPLGDAHQVGNLGTEILKNLA